MQLFPGIEAGKKLGWVWNILLLPEIKNAFKNVKGSAARTKEPNGFWGQALIIRALIKTGQARERMCSR